ncbi:UNVERIFIED_CONTAM: hypothetical protein GTU68_027106, partial [Idotea baltica]|nr:hypothetical protein [Idotea baltica]
MVPDDTTKDLITALLHHSPLDRLGTVGGATELKEHPFFYSIDWNSLLRLKAEFVPQLNDDEDTSYFDTRLDRYNHEMEEDSEEGGDMSSIGGSGAFGSFSSCSPRYHHRMSVSLSTDNSQQDSTLLSDAAESSSLQREKEKEEEHERDAEDLDKGSVSRGDSGHSDQSESSRSTLESSTNTPDRENREFSNAPESGGKKRSECFGAPVSHSTPESSQTESDEISPQIQRRRRMHSHSTSAIPRFSISGDEEALGLNVSVESSGARELSPVDEKPGSSHLPCPRVSVPINVPSKHRNRTVIKSASASGLSLMIPADECPYQPLQSPGGGSSTASSRDTSPSREISPLVNSLKPPIIIRRGAQGFGFTIRAIRVYFGDSDFYTVHHLVSDVDQKGPAFDAGLRPGDLITHLNGEAIQGMFHTQVVTLLMGSSDHVTLRAVPLDQTSIRPGGRKRSLNTSKLAKRMPGKGRQRKKDIAEKKRRTSLIRKISIKRVPTEVQQLSAVGSPTVLTPSRSFQSLTRSVSSQEGASSSGNVCYMSPHSPPTARLFAQSDPSLSPANSSGSSSP